jgi:hypothetical protein
MATYLITYDLTDRSREDALLAYIRGWPWARVSASSYAVASDKTTTQMSEDIRAIAKDAITFAVLTITRPWDGFLPQDIIHWLNAGLA